MRLPKRCQRRKKRENRVMAFLKDAWFVADIPPPRFSPGANTDCYSGKSTQRSSAPVRYGG